MSGNVISLSNHSSAAKRIADDSIADDIDTRPADTTVEKIEITRVQLRMAVEDIAQVERDLTLLRDTCDRGLVMCRSARRGRRDLRDMPLASIRAMFTGLNRMLNVKHQGR